MRRGEIASGGHEAMNYFDIYIDRLNSFRYYFMIKIQHGSWEKYLCLPHHITKRKTLLHMRRSQRGHWWEGVDDTYIKEGLGYWHIYFTFQSQIQATVWPILEHGSSLHDA